MSNSSGSGNPGRIRIAVLFGGQSDEHDVSLRSAQTVSNALDPDKYEVVPIGITRDGRWIGSGDPMARLTAMSPFFAVGAGSGDGTVTQSASTDLAVPGQSDGLPIVFGGSVDVVFPVLHGPLGEDGTIQGMMELANVPYVGSGVLGSAVAMDKAATKTILAEAGLPQVPHLVVFRRDWERDPESVTALVTEKLGYPVFIKPANLGSSVGISKVHDPAELPAAMNEAAMYDRKLVIEKGVDAREIEISVLGNDDPIASVAGEIVPSNEFYDYAAKYIDDRSELIIPAKLDPDVLAAIQKLAIKAFRALDLAGLARVDFFLERETNRLYVNEVNTIPGFTSISMYPMLWGHTGIPLAELVDRLVELALERHAEKRR